VRFRAPLQSQSHACSLWLLLCGCARLLPVRLLEKLASWSRRFTRVMSHPAPPSALRCMRAIWVFATSTAVLLSLKGPHHSVPVAREYYASWRWTRKRATAGRLLRSSVPHQQRLIVVGSMPLGIGDQYRHNPGRWHRIDWGAPATAFPSVLPTRLCPYQNLATEFMKRHSRHGGTHRCSASEAETVCLRGDSETALSWASTVLWTLN
jgi:hypothetical protein